MPLPHCIDSCDGRHFGKQPLSSHPHPGDIRTVCPCETLLDNGLKTETIRKEIAQRIVTYLLECFSSAHFSNLKPETIEQLLLS